jgi:hypothetical protein
MMTESEAWTALADTMEMIDGMVPVNGEDGVVPALGLCHTVRLLYVDGLISWTMADRMGASLRRVRPSPDSRIYYWRAGEHKPRIKACRSLARSTVSL